jgi:uncharacterized damage-inducible protein DinB
MPTARPKDIHSIPVFYRDYVSEVPGDDLNVALLLASDRLHALMDGLSDEQASHRYAPGKWMVKEVLQHIVDAERIFAYRALRFGRNDSTELPGFEEDDYVPEARCEARMLDDMLKEHDAVRAATTTLFNSFDERALERVGTANGNQIGVRAIGWVIAGHALHHIRILHERYLP